MKAVKLWARRGSAIVPAFYIRTTGQGTVLPLTIDCGSTIPIGRWARMENQDPTGNTSATQALVTTFIFLPV
jgi:hypothetical protein